MGGRGSKQSPPSEATAQPDPSKKNHCPINVKLLSGDSIDGDLSGCINIADVRQTVASAIDVAAMRVVLLDGETELDDPVLLDTFEQGHTVLVVLLEAEFCLRICYRIRPLIDGERGRGTRQVLRVTGPQTISVDGHGAFSCDSVFMPGTQEDVFNQCKDIIQSALKGASGAILAYGQSNSGKSHTLFGDLAGEESLWGVVQKSFAEIQQFVQQSGARDGAVTFSFCELRGSELKDLLGSDLYPDILQDCSIEELLKEPCSNHDDLQRLLSRGTFRRITYKTLLAQNGSASQVHAFVIFRITLTEPSTKKKLKGTLLLGDLAGSDTHREHTEYAKKVHTSFSKLPDVLEAVAAGRRTIPHDYDKLIYMLKDPMSWPGKTLLIVALSPTSNDLEESRKSLDFTLKTGRVIKAGLEVNEHSGD